MLRISASEVRDRVRGAGPTACPVGRPLPAVDINPHAVAAARENAARNGVADRVDVRESDVFSVVDGVFDLVVFGPPFRWFAPRDWLEVATTDANYRPHRRRPGPPAQRMPPHI